MAADGGKIETFLQEHCTNKDITVRPGHSPSTLRREKVKGIVSTVSGPLLPITAGVGGAVSKSPKLDYPAKNQVRSAAVACLEGLES